METTDSYREKLRTIADYAFAHSDKTLGSEFFNGTTPFEWEDVKRKQFIVACNEGFKIAQSLLIEEIKKYQSLYRETDIELKESRRKNDKNGEHNTKAKKKVIEQRLHTFSHIADGIAWQLLGGQIHIARRLHIGQDASKFLDYSNIQHAITEADKFNALPEAIALISDITSFIQIGDLLVKHNDNIYIIELKEGKVNEQILEFLEKSKNSGIEVTEDVLKSNFSDDTVHQIQRMQRQEKRGLQATNVICKDEGIDPVSGCKIVISTPQFDTEYYHDELSKLHDTLQEKTWAYGTIDNCLHIGMYRNESIAYAYELIPKILEQQTENYLVIDLLSITTQLSEPLFGKPFSPDFIIDILTGRIKVIIGLNIDCLIDLYNYHGIKARWLSKKETAKARQNAIREGMIVIKNRGIQITQTSGQRIILSGGTLSKILYDSIRPRSVVLSMHTRD